MVSKFFKFCVVGCCGLVVDSLCFYILYPLVENMMAARVFSFWCAATTTWLGNRYFSFSLEVPQPMAAQWLRHMSSVHASGALNLLCFYGLSEFVVLPVAFSLGILIGTLANYALADQFVFSNRN